MVALFVIGMFLLFVAADALVMHRRRSRESAAVCTAGGPASAVFGSRGMPSGMFLHPSHTWLTVDPSGVVKIGLDELSLRLLGPLGPGSVVLPEPGSRVAAGETMLKVRFADIEIPIPSPVTGTIESTQESFRTRHSEGVVPDAWCCSLRPDRLARDLKPLRIAEDARAWLVAEFARLHGMLPSLRPAAATLPDGGEPAAGLLRLLDAAGRETVLREFLSPK
ncbi:MAG: hypothetical protein QME96_02385 [Myxococcota bacterium]|nr:hypothetical protein [Myxococcota bacterium]